MSPSASDRGETCSHTGMDRVRHSKPGSVKGVCGYETRRRTKDLSAFSVFNVEKCFKDSYPRNMTCVNKIFVKILAAGELFSPLPSGTETEQRPRKLQWSSRQSKF